jgi:hypothetical protein
MNIQNNNMKPATSQYYDDILSLTNSTLLTADMILMYKKKTCTQYATIIKTKIHSFRGKGKIIFGSHVRVQNEILGLHVRGQNRAAVRSFRRRWREGKHVLMSLIIK